MKITTKILLTMSAVTASVTLVYLIRRLNTRRRLTIISNEGYETAHDILYPTKYNRARKLHYGPVIPMNDHADEIIKHPLR